MPELIKSNRILIIVIVLLSILYISGYQTVPFHPDETTHIFMSGDWQLLFTDPLNLSWDPNSMDSNQTFLRSLGAPLTKYLFGLVRTATGLDLPAADWDWTKTWNENINSGAFPDPDVLKVSRLTTTIMTLVAHVFLYYCVKRIWGQPAAVISILVMGLNPLILLHGRRAMNEAAALLGISFFLWTLAWPRNTSFLTGISTAFSFNAKQILLLLLPVGIIAVSWTKQTEKKHLTISSKLISLFGVFATITVLLNPFFWTYPIDSVKHSLTTIKELQTNQLEDFYQGRNRDMLQKIPYRLIALMGNLYFSPLSYSDVGNYDSMIADQVQQYDQQFLHTFLRNRILASILIGLTLVGLARTTIQLNSQVLEVKKVQILLLLTTILLINGVLFLQPVPWQRYTVTLVPLTAIWTSAGIAPFFKNIIIS